MLIRIVSILFPLFAITAAGYFIGRRMKPDLSHANRLNMDVFVPALIFAALANREFRITEYLPLAAGTLAVVLGSGAIAWAVARLLKVEVKTLVPPLMFNNCGNLGLPLAVLAFGEAALMPAVVMFMVSNLMHFSLGVWMLDHRVRLTTIWRVPSVSATVVGLAVGLAGIQLWEPLLVAVRMLGEISVPLMLFALGVRLTDARITSIGLGVFAAVLRPAMGMLLVWLVLQFIDLPAREQALLLVFGALPPAVLNYIFAERYRQEPEKVASMVLIGNLAAVLSLPMVLLIAL